MISIPRLARSFALAVVVAGVLAPAAALAETSERPAPFEKSQHAFPMKAEQFEKIVVRRIEKAREKVARKAEKEKAPPKMQEEIRADFDAGAAAVLEAVDKASDDGLVTRDEAKRVRDVAEHVRKALREKYVPVKGASKAKKGKDAERGRDGKAKPERAGDAKGKKKGEAAPRCEDER
jgi:hypothetical protein